MKSFVNKSLQSVKTGLSNVQNKGLRGIFVFAGPTGVGKTETFNIISTLLEKFYIKKGPIYSMTEYINETDINKLIGSPPGYAGSNTGYLGEFLLNNPFTVICFDEFEKCHLTIKQTFLGILQGDLMLGSGDRVDLSNVIVIFTTNAGNKNFIKIDSTDSNLDIDANEHNKNVVVESLKRDYFVPDELIGRLNNYIISFNHISLNEAKEIIRRKMIMSKNKYHESVSDYFLNQFITQPQYGARDLINAIDNKLNSEDFQEMQNKTIYMDKRGNLRIDCIDDKECYKQKLSSNDREKDKQIAIHEIGHAICAAELFGISVIEDISISESFNRIPGVTRLNFSSHFITNEILFKQVCALLAGRVAERIVYQNNFSSGCSKDISDANSIVKAMVCELGMADDDLPPIDYKIISNGSIPNEYYTEMIKKLTDANIQAQDILTRYRKLLEKLSETLVDKKILDQETFKQVWDRRLEYTT